MASVPLKRLGSSRLLRNASGLRLFSTFRNEILRLPFFFEYYRQLGVDEFVVVDNASTDGTCEWLLQQPDVYVFSAHCSYRAANYGYEWIEYLLREFGRGRWCVLADADEFLQYPFCESRNLVELTAFLDTRHESAIFALLLDMYSNSQFGAIEYTSGTNPIEVCPYFDRDTHFLKVQRDSNVQCDESRVGEPGNYYLGGMRYRVLGVAPCLNKVPLLKYDTNMRLFPGAHFIEGATLSAMRGAVLHFKFLHDFPARVREETQRKEHYQLGAQYESYASALHSNIHLNPYSQDSEYYVDTTQLLHLGLIRTSSGWGPAIKDK